MKIFYTLILICIGTFVLAETTKKDSEARPVSSISKANKSFEVGGLKACTAEFDTEVAIVEFKEEKQAQIKPKATNNK